jgi:DNA-binding transcriptional LysR family regulator
MDFDRLRALVWTIDEGSVTAAALRLHRTQPAVTRLLRTLEESVGRPLIDRSARPLVPTPAGRQVIETARQILQMADTLMAPGGAEPVPRLALRIGMSRSLLWHLNGHAFASPPKHLRELDYRIRSGPGSDIYRAFCRKEIDCAAVLMPLDWCPSIRCSTALVREERLVMIAPKKTRRAANDDGAAEANGDRWILNPDGCGVRDALIKALARQGQRLQVRYEVDAAPQDHIAMVAAGLGVSVVPAATLRHHPQSSAVMKCALDDERLVMGVWLLASEAVAAIDGLATHLRRVLGGAVARSLRPPVERSDAVPRVA